MQVANETGTPLVPVSSGEPRVHAGSRPSVPGAVQVDVRGMDRILWIDRRNRLVLLEPGVTYAQLVPVLAAEGLRVAMPLVPRPGKSVIASLLEREPIVVPRWHWNPMEPLRSLEVVWGNGERLLTGAGTFRGETAEDWEQGRVPVTGGGPGQLDFFRLVSGAQGTMGIVTWASVKVEPVSAMQQLRLVAAERLEDLVDLAYALLRVRFGDETFILDARALAMLLARESQARAALAAELPPWCLVLGIGGGSILASEKVAARTADIEELAVAHGLAAVPAVPGCVGDDLLEVIQAPSSEPYWKTSPEQPTRDVFCLAPLADAPGHVSAVAGVAASAPGGPEVGVYLQPIHMGAGCHCEFILPAGDGTSKSLPDEVERMLFDRGAYFSRPYGPVTHRVFDADPATRDLVRAMKGIFDPHDVMNPGRLCFPTRTMQEATDGIG